VAAIDQERDKCYEENDELYDQIEQYELDIQNLQSYINELETDRVEIINELEVAKE
jgi:hypothetical protein